jgi:hypothetical protein
VEEYPSHGFVIDRREAEELFVTVRNLNQDEDALVRLNPLRGSIRNPHDEPLMGFLSEARKEEKNAASDSQDPRDGESTAGVGDPVDEALVGGEEPQRSGAVAELPIRKRAGAQ